MSSSSRTPIIARIPGSRSLVNDHAPIEQGRKRGYFKDKKTKALLSLNKGDFLRADGTYGDKEIAHRPVDFALLREGSYNHHSVDGVLFHACSLDGLWLIHDNYPSSIPLFISCGIL